MSGIFFVGQCFKNNYFDFFIRDKTSYMFLFELCLWLAKSLSLPQACALKKSCSDLTCEHQWLWISILSTARHCILTLFSNSLKTLAELSLLACLASGSVWPRKRCLWPDSHWGLLTFLCFSLVCYPVSSVLRCVHGKLWFCRSFMLLLLQMEECFSFRLSIT